MVSSIVPRLEDKCPPVLLTDSIRKLRSSSASCGNCARSSLRSSSGKLVVLSNGYITPSPPPLSHQGRGDGCHCTCLHFLSRLRERPQSPIFSPELNP